MNTEQNISKETIASDFQQALSGTMGPEQIQETVQSLVQATTSYSANGSVASMIFYLQFQVNINGGKSFNGKAGGISSPGGGALFGDIYTDDLDRLYSDTHSFQFNATPVYLNINFFDGNSNFLGHFQSGAISTVLGTGGGTGSWS